MTRLQKLGIFLAACWFFVFGVLLNLKPPFIDFMFLFGLCGAAIVATFFFGLSWVFKKPNQHTYEILDD